MVAGDVGGQGRRARAAAAAEFWVGSAGLREEAERQAGWLHDRQLELVGLLRLDVPEVDCAGCEGMGDPRISIPLPHHERTYMRIATVPGNSGGI